MMSTIEDTHQRTIEHLDFEPECDLRGDRCHAPAKWTVTYAPNCGCEHEARLACERCLALLIRRYEARTGRHPRGPKCGHCGVRLGGTWRDWIRWEPLR